MPSPPAPPNKFTAIENMQNEAIDLKALYGKPSDSDLTDSSNVSIAETGLPLKTKLSHHANKFKPVIQLRLAWTFTILALTFLILTAVYASQETIALHLHFLYGSSSNTIFLLSFLSHLTG